MVNALSFASTCPIPKQAAASSLLSSRCHNISSHAPRLFSLSSRNLNSKSLKAQAAESKESSPSQESSQTTKRSSILCHNCEGNGPPDAIHNLLTKITVEMQQVKMLYGRIKEEEKQVATEFMLVARHVDEILTDLKSANKDLTQDLQSQLQQVGQVIKSMSSKLLKAIGEFNATGSNSAENQGSASASTSLS